MILVAPISSRNQFGPLLNSMGLTKTAVEIGTHRGDFARILLQSWEGRTLFCVDPWSIPDGYAYQAEILVATLGGAADREDDYREADKLRTEFSGRVFLLRWTSTVAAERVTDSMLDFVYLDGDHREEQVRIDLEVWWPKIRAGGVLAGHDFICPGPKEGNWGKEVQPAVLDFAREEGVDIQVVVEEGGQPWSFYLVRS